MAQSTYSIFAFFLIINILLVTTRQAVAGRNIAKDSNNDDKKEPEFLFKHDHVKKVLHFPRIGHLGFPPNIGLTPNNPFTGGSRGVGSRVGSGSTGRSYIPGGDDTFVPNPGYETPIPGSSGVVGGRVTPTVHP